MLLANLKTEQLWEAMFPQFEEQADGGNRNVAINIKSDSVMRQMNKVHLLIN